MLSAPAGPYPAVPGDVMDYLHPFLERDPIGIAPAAYPPAMSELTSVGVVGGSVYDGLIGLAVKQHDAELISLDVRAARTYARLGVGFRLLTRR